MISPEYKRTSPRSKAFVTCIFILVEILAVHTYLTGKLALQDSIGFLQHTQYELHHVTCSLHNIQL